MERDPGIVALPTDAPVWGRVFTVSPLVLVGTIDPNGAPDLAPKHMATPLGWSNYFAFVCSPRHGTYANAAARGVFTVSYPQPSQILQASLAAGRRQPDDSKPTLAALQTFPADVVDGVLVTGCSFWLECELDRVIDGFGENSLVIGRVVAAAADERALRDADRDDGDLIHETPLLAFLSPGRFAQIDESNAFPFPADFRL
jgi:flavin reductase (DIM6/NTAB) family NADH-FMN oxidoreductase RutF